MLKKFLNDKANTLKEKLLNVLMIYGINVAWLAVYALPALSFFFPGQVSTTLFRPPSEWFTTTEALPEIVWGILMAPLWEELIFRVAPPENSPGIRQKAWAGNTYTSSTP